jgi:hypothetical protein
MSRDDITGIVGALGDLTRVVQAADAADTADTADNYAQLKLTRTYQPEEKLVQATIKPA